ncbi:Nn.00g042700.m01.CDS01 [Neocucurbitaria sp. VM-36]
MEPIPEVSTQLAPDAATEALARCADSVRELLKFQHVYTGRAEAQKTISIMQSENRAKDEKISELELAIAVFTRGGNKEVSRMKLENAEVKQEMSGLRSQLQKEIEERALLETQLKNTKQFLAEKATHSTRALKDVSALKAENEMLKAKVHEEKLANADLGSQLDLTRNKLNTFTGYTANLITLNLSKLPVSSRGDLIKIWERTDGLVTKYFSLDISTETLDDHDTWTQQACTFLRPPSGSILIPPTNSPAAKFARKTVMLAVLAQVFAQFVFTATPPRFARSGLDRVLSELADQNEEKELLCRAMLLSVPSGSQPDDKDIQQGINWILESFGTLLSPKTRVELKAGIKGLMADAAKFWSNARESRQKLVSVLDYEMYPESWHTYSASNPERQKTTNNVKVSDPDDDEDEITFVAFPATVSMSAAGSKTVNPGWVIRYSHLIRAEEEWRREQKRRRFSRSGVPNNIELGNAHVAMAS